MASRKMGRGTLFDLAGVHTGGWNSGVGRPVIALDAGHVVQNLYLAGTAMGIGTCAVAAYDQDDCDELLAVDSEEEFTVYIAPVGRIGRPTSPDKR